MRVLIGAELVTLGEVLGIGGEATVYRAGDRAVKIFHAVDRRGPPGQSSPDRTLLDAKLGKLFAFPRDLPPEVVAPEIAVRDAVTEAPIGYAMPAIHGARELSQLMKKSRPGAITHAEVCALFAKIHAVLSALHQRRVIVGDLNDGNLLFAGRRPWFIDVDSMQLPGHPCTVAHERYLDPRLYGTDLSAGTYFTAETDWYAFAVLLFTALLFVHPYGGVHPQLPTLVRRAAARASVFDPIVKLPKAADDWRSLPDGLIDHFRAVFADGRRGLFPRALLDLSFEVRRTVVPPARAIRVNRAVRALRIFQTEGRILAASLQPALAWLCEDDGIVRREDGSRVMEQPVQLGMQFAIAGPRTWIGFDGKLACIEREQVVDRAITGGRFDAGTAGCFVEQEGWLLEQESRARMGKILEGQTSIFVGRSLGFGFYRPGRGLFAFLFQPGRPGLIDVRLPAFNGKLLAADAAFDDRQVAVSLLYDDQGVRRGALYLIGADGRILGALEGAVEEERILATTTGRAVRHGRIIASTDEGLVLLRAEPSGALSPETIFTDTEPFVEEGAQLLPGPNGSIYVITGREITQLEVS